MNTQTIIAAAGAILLLAACDVKDPIFNTPHPGHGMVTLTTEWSGIGAGLSVPESYTVTASLTGSTAAGYSAMLTGVTNKLDHLFEPGDYLFCVYNTPQQLAVSKTTASVAAAPAPADAAGPFVHGTPGWLFTAVIDAAIEKDTEQRLTAPMQQQVRQLTLLIEPTGGTTDRIGRIEAVLSGVAGTMDFASGTHSVPSNAALTFEKVTEGRDAGKWSATVRLLGVAGTQQRLTGTIRFTDGQPTPVALDSDLTKALAGFNADKRRPLTLDGTVADTPDEAGFTATIDDWEVVTGGPVVAE